MIRIRRRTFGFAALALTLLGGAGSATVANWTQPCQALLPAPPIANNPGEAQTQKANGRHWSNRAIRAQYVCRVEGIAQLDRQWQAEQLPAKERAERAYQIRHDARLTARAMMDNPQEVAALEARDQQQYGHPDGPTFEELYQLATSKGLDGDAAYSTIIASAQRTNRWTNLQLGIE